MGISVSIQNDLGFDSSNSLQPLLGDKHIVCPWCLLKWVPAMGKSPWQWGAVTLTGVVERGRGKTSSLVNYFSRTILLVLDKGCESSPTIALGRAGAVGGSDPNFRLHVQPSVNPWSSCLG